MDLGVTTRSLLELHDDIWPPFIFINGMGLVPKLVTSKQACGESTPIARSALLFVCDHSIFIFFMSFCGSPCLAVQERGIKTPKHHRKIFAEAPRKPAAKRQAFSKQPFLLNLDEVSTNSKYRPWATSVLPPSKSSLHSAA